MPGRKFNSNSYKYGYQGSEKDDEISGEGNAITTHYRGLDTRLGRWWSVDSKASEQSYQSPYSSMDGNPIKNIDPLGDCVPCLEAAAIVSEVATIYRATKGARTLISIIKEVRMAHSTFGEITLEGRDLNDPIIVNTKENYPMLYDAYLLNRYHADKYATVDIAFGAIVKVQVLNAEKAEAEKKVPNPNGKKGGAAHQGKVKEAEQELADQGFEVETEVQVKTPNGEKGSRFIDVQGKKDGKTINIQVGKQNKNGTPVSRERKAENDIKDATGQDVEFRPYN